MAEELTLVIERPDDLPEAAVVHCTGYIDTHTFDQMDSALSKLVDDGVRYLVVDLSQVNYMSSAGIGSLLEHVKKCERAEGGLGIYGLAGMVKDIFTQMQIDMLFTMGESAEDTLIKLGARGR